MSKSNVLSVGYGRHIFSSGNFDRSRMMACSQETESLHMVIFCHINDSLDHTMLGDKLFLHPTNSKNKIMMIFDAVRIGRKITKQKDFIITTQDPFDAGLVGFFIKLGSKMPLVVQEHADFFSTKFWRSESTGNFLRIYLGKFILRRANIVRVVSERIRQSVLKINPQAVVRALPVTIDVSKFTEPRTTEKISYFKPGTFVFLSVARFVEQKNIPLMIEAFATAYAKSKNIRLLLVGTGPLQSDIEALVKTSFKVAEGEEFPVKVLDWSNDVPGLMRSVDAYLLTSNYEGWARVLIEAMCSDLPTVTTDVGCANEVLKNGIHGIVTQVNNKEEMVNAIASISSNQELYQQFKTNLSQLDKKTLPGVDMTNYGRDWVRSLN